jgi:hypothetical protein
VSDDPIFPLCPRCGTEMRQVVLFRRAVWGCPKCPDGLDDIVVELFESWTLTDDDLAMLERGADE